MQIISLSDKKQRLLTLFPKAPKIPGTINPVNPPIKLIIPNIVPAKLGDKSCAFRKFVIVAAPFIAILRTKSVTFATALHLATEMNIRHIPGNT